VVGRIRPSPRLVDVPISIEIETSKREDKTVELGGFREYLSGKGKIG